MNGTCARLSGYTQRELGGRSEAFSALEAAAHLAATVESLDLLAASLALGDVDFDQRVRHVVQQHVPEGRQQLR